MQRSSGSLNCEYLIDFVDLHIHNMLEAYLRVSIIKPFSFFKGLVSGRQPAPDIVQITQRICQILPKPKNICPSEWHGPDIWLFQHCSLPNCSISNINLNLLMIFPRVEMKMNLAKSTLSISMEDSKSCIIKGLEEIIPLSWGKKKWAIPKH